MATFAIDEYGSRIPKMNILYSILTKRLCEINHLQKYRLPRCYMISLSVIDYEIASTSRLTSGEKCTTEYGVEAEKRQLR